MSDDDENEVLSGVYYDLEAQRYHDYEALGSGGAKKILETPLHFRVFRTEEERKVSDAKLFGRALHTGVLEPHLFDSQVIVWPDFNLRTNLGKQEKAIFEEMHRKKVIISPKAFDKVRRSADAILRSSMARQLLDGAKKEVSGFWLDGQYKVPCKARWDGVSHGGIADLKSCADASPEGFGKASANYEYPLQAAHYWTGYETLFNATPEFFIFIAVESDLPHAVAFYEVNKHDLAIGWRKADEAYARYKLALDTGVWPGYPDEVKPLQLPRYYMRHDI